MMNWRARVRIWAFVCVTGLTLTGCAGGDGGQAADDEGSGDKAVSPLAQYLGGAGSTVSRSGGGIMVHSSSAEEPSEADRQKMRQVEELVATCMRDAGFEYVPISVDDDVAAPDVDDAFSLDEDEFAERYGYGISTMMASRPEPGAESDDPNQKIRNSLSEAAQKAYDEALWGDLAGATISGGAKITTGEPTTPGGTENPGCQAKAGEEVYGKPEGIVEPDFEAFNGLFEDLGALSERVSNDPRVVEVERAWAECMAAAGFSDLGTPGEAQESVFSRMNELYGMDTEDPESDPPAGKAEIDEAALEELQAYELDVAGADRACQQDGYQDVFDKVNIELETQFVEEHRAELERYRDAMAEGPVGHAGGIG